MRRNLPKKPSEIVLGSNLKDEIKSLEEHKGNLEVEVKKLANQLPEDLPDIGSVKEEYDERTKLVIQLNDKIKDIEDFIKVRKQELFNVQSKVNEKVKENNELVAIIENNRENVRNSNILTETLIADNKKKLEESNKEELERLEFNKGLNVKLIKDISDNEDKLRKTQEDIVKVEQQITNSYGRFANIQKDISEATFKLEEIEKSIKTAGEDLENFEDLRLKRDDIVKDIGLKRKELMSIENSIRTRKKEFEGFQKDLDEATKNIEDTRTNLKAGQEELLLNKMKIQKQLVRINKSIKQAGINIILEL